MIYWPYIYTLSLSKHHTAIHLVLHRSTCCIASNCSYNN